jgi:hypothetical protein
MNDSLIYGIATLGVGLLALIVKYGFKSKCSDVSLCFGLIHIQRDITQEIEEQKLDGGQSVSKEMSLRNMNNV